jgi:hypothetical protein
MMDSSTLNLNNLLYIGLWIGLAIEIVARSAAFFKLSLLGKFRDVGIVLATSAVLGLVINTLLGDLIPTSTRQVLSISVPSMFIAIWIYSMLCKKTSEQQE